MTTSDDMHPIGKAKTLEEINVLERELYLKRIKANELELEALKVEFENKFEKVDLGLPSGLLWFSHNVGADNDHEYGMYFNFDEATNIGGTCRLPSKEDFDELIDNTDSEWIENYKGKHVSGRMFMKKDDPSTYIFFPAAGYYMGNSLYSDGSYGCYLSSSYLNSSYVYNFYFDTGNVSVNGYATRNIVQSVRMVCNKKNND